MKRSLSTISQSIERWMKVSPRGRNSAPRSRELSLWFPIPHATLTSVRQSVPKLRRAGSLNGRSTQYSARVVSSASAAFSRRSGFIYADSLVELVLTNVTLLGFVVAIPYMLSACEPRFAKMPEHVSADAVAVAAVNPPPRAHVRKTHHRLMNQQTQLR